jgi:hypothetical protein
LGWNEEGLWLVAVVEDEAVKPNAQLLFGGDVVELFVDKLNQGAPNALESKAITQYFLAPSVEPAESPTPGLVSIVDQGTRTRKKPVKALRCVSRRTERGYILETLIPADELKPADWQAGEKLGLHFNLSNDGRAVEEFVSSKKYEMNHERPITWGTVVLGP